MDIDVGKCSSSLRSDVDLGSSPGSEFLMSRDEIGVEVSLENIADRALMFGGCLQIQIDVSLRIDHDRFAL
jgi:hypothetical protein